MNNAIHASNGRCSRLQGVSVFVGIAGMLVALLTSPFFHFHDRDDHGDHANVVHAHLLEAEEHEAHSTPEIEESHSHHDARWVDVFTFNDDASGFALAVDVPKKSSIAVPEQQWEFVLAATPRAHGPPTSGSSVPRSPPTC